MKCAYGDCRESMRRLIAEGVKVQMCVTSPPYWGLRRYLFDKATILRYDLSEEEKEHVKKELQKLKIKPRM